MAFWRWFSFSQGGICIHSLEGTCFSKPFHTMFLLFPATLPVFNFKSRHVGGRQGHHGAQWVYTPNVFYVIKGINWWFKRSNSIERVVYKLWYLIMITITIVIVVNFNHVTIIAIAINDTKQWPHVSRIPYTYISTLKSTPGSGNRHPHKVHRLVHRFRQLESLPWCPGGVFSWWKGFCRSTFQNGRLNPLPSLKMDGWNTRFLLGPGPFSDANC